MEASRLVRRTRVLGGPRRIAARTAAAVAGGALVLSGLAFVPAEAGVTDLLGTVAPQIEGSGRITGDDGYLCSATGDLGVLSPCKVLDLGGVLGLTTTLVPTAADGWEFAGWTDCPDVVADSCVLDPSVLDGLTGSVLEPVARFVPLPAGGDPSAPDTRITGAPGVDADQKSTETDVEFTFTLEGDADEPGFECSLSGPGHARGFTACGSGATTGTKRYTGLEPGDYTFSVRALDGDEADPTPARFSWTLTGRQAPDTRLRGGPRPGGWLRSKHVAFRLRSDQAGATYRCAVDGKARRCGSRLELRRVSAGTHTVRAAAVAGGLVDRSPARRTFTRPYDDRALKHGTAWRERVGTGTFLGTYSQTAKKGATLRMRARHITKVALVVSKGRGFGTVKVYLGKRLLKKVSLRAKTLRKRQLVPVERFRKPRRGVVRVVVVTRGKVVRIEGLGIARR